MNPKKDTAFPRSFSRMFMIVTFGKGWCVMKEELSVTDATVKKGRCMSVL
jgi:hypothetical protein